MNEGNDLEVIVHVVFYSVCLKSMLTVGSDIQHG
jgi:hypothetical protein